MDARLNRFNKVAGMYDTLVHIIFGKSILHSQLVFLKAIPPRATMLILGGGTGKILPYLMRENLSCQIFYIEASSSMLALARKNAGEFHNENIHFIHGTEDAIPPHILFDVVITNFFLDMFSPLTLKKIVAKINGRLRIDGIWMATDFVNNTNWKHRILLNAMYLFFRIVSSIEAKELPAWHDELLVSGLSSLDNKFFFQGFIRSALLSKKSINQSELTLSQFAVLTQLSLP